MQAVQAYSELLEPTLKGLCFGLWPMGATETNDIRSKILAAALLAFSFTAVPVHWKTRSVTVLTYSSLLLLAHLTQKFAISRFFLKHQTSLMFAFNANGAFCELYEGQRLYPLVKLGVVALFGFDKWNPLPTNFKVPFGIFAGVAYPLFKGIEFTAQSLT